MGGGEGSYKLWGDGSARKNRKNNKRSPFIKHLGGVNKSSQTMLDGTFSFQEI